jgi:hypothetical protein
VCALDFTNNPIYYEVTEPLQVIFHEETLASASEFSCTFEQDRTKGFDRLSHIFSCNSPTSVEYKTIVSRRKHHVFSKSPKICYA